MQKRRTVVRALILYLSLFTVASGAQGDTGPKDSGRESGISMRLGSLKITNKVVELRCEISNGSGQDIWLCLVEPSENSPNGTRATDAGVFLDRAHRTFIIFRQMNSPYNQVYGPQCVATYVCLRAAQTRSETFFVGLPVVLPDSFRERLMGPTESDGNDVARLTFVLAYYTTADLNSRKAGPRAFQKMDFDESGGKVVIHDVIAPGRWDDERAVNLTIDGISIPYRHWLFFDKGITTSSHSRRMLMGGTLMEHMLQVFFQNNLDPQEYRYADRLLDIDENLFDDSARQIADIYVQLAEGKLRPAELTARLDSVLDKSEREKLLNDLQEKEVTASIPKVHLTPTQELQDIFYESSLQLYDYQYAKELLAVEKDLLEGASRQIADIYIDVARGKIDPKVLAQRLDAILPKSARDDLLHQLQRKQAGGGKGDGGVRARPQNNN